MQKKNRLKVYIIFFLRCAVNILYTCILRFFPYYKIDEDFKEAKIYKELGDRLTGLWRFLINLETDKQQAVESKNYDEADKIKVTNHYTNKYVHNRNCL